MKYPKLLVSLFLWFYIPGLCHSQHEEFAGPYRVLVDQVGNCDDTGTRQIYMSSTKIRKVGRNKYTYSTNVTTEIALCDDLTAETDIAVFGNGGWRPHYMQIDLSELCTSVKKLLPSYYNAVMRIVGTDCPIPPGTYEVKEVGLENLKVSSFLPNLPYGRYRTDFFLRNNGTLIGCVRLFSNVIPAKSRRYQKIPNK